MGIVYGGGALGGVILSLSFEQLIQKVGLPWTFRIYGFAIFLIGYPAAWLLVERPVRQARHLVDLSLFRDHRFLLLIAGAVIGCFPLFVPAFFLPSYATTIGLTSAQGAGLVAGYNVASLVGRLGFGTASDRFGPLNCLITTLLLNAFSFLAIWPVSTTLTPLIFFVVLNGAANVSLPVRRQCLLVALLMRQLALRRAASSLSCQPSSVRSLALRESASQWPW